MKLFFCDRCKQKIENYSDINFVSTYFAEKTTENSRNEKAEVVSAELCDGCKVKLEIIIKEYLDKKIKKKLPTEIESSLVE